MTIEIQQPEIEALIEQRLSSGVFRDVEEVLLYALKTAPPRTETNGEGTASRKNLTEFLTESPLRNSGLQLERNQDYPRPVAL